MGRTGGDGVRRVEEAGLVGWGGDSGEVLDRPEQKGCRAGCGLPFVRAK